MSFLTFTSTQSENNLFTTACSVSSIKVNTNVHVTHYVESISQCCKQPVVGDGNDMVVMGTRYVLDALSAEQRKWLLVCETDIIWRRGVGLIRIHVGIHNYRSNQLGPINSSYDQEIHNSYL